MKPVSSVDISNFVTKCPDYDGRMYFPCIKVCFKENKYMSGKCKEVKKEYFDQIDRITGYKTR